jgi:hypothetical protein
VAQEDLARFSYTPHLVSEESPPINP